MSGSEKAILPSPRTKPRRDIKTRRKRSAASTVSLDHGAEDAADFVLRPEERTPWGRAIFSTRVKNGLNRHAPRSREPDRRRTTAASIAVSIRAPTLPGGLPQSVPASESVREVGFGALCTNA